MANRSPSRGSSFVTRRNFLRGAAGVGIGLPFLEGLPERSAWAEGAAPIFSLFVCAVDGVVPAKFFPAATGPLTSDGLASAQKATSELAPFAKQLLFLKGIDWPQVSPTDDAHAQGLCMALTAMKPSGTSREITATGPSADVVVGSMVQPAGTPPLVLYAGNRKNGYIAERLSFSGPGKVLAGQDNPYTLYQELVGLLLPDGSVNPDAVAAARQLAESRKSVHDLVREELADLKRNTRLSSADRVRLEQHLDGIRDVEIGMGNLGLRCATGPLDLQRLESFKDFVYDAHGMVEDMVQMHMSVTALAFACNFRRTASLQWGDGTDHTIYDVPANEELGGWPFNFICHRTQSDSAAGNNPIAEQAHSEIDALRMRSLAYGLTQFQARGLAEHSFVLWTNGFTDCPGHAFKSVPHILWGNAGGYLKQGEYVDCGGVGNNRLLNTLITAAARDTGTTVTDFGEGTPGLLDAIIA